jgi:DNA-binding MarR family transcriptional regulator
MFLKLFYLFLIVYFFSSSIAVRADGVNSGCIKESSPSIAELASSISFKREAGNLDVSPLFTSNLKSAQSDEQMSVKESYSESIVMIERLHRLFLDVIKRELDRLGTHDINSLQVLILYNIGDNQLTVSELTNLGYYLGSSISYNLRKMVQNHYVEQIPSSRDHRSSHVKLSAKGLALYKKFDQILTDHTVKLESEVADEVSFRKFRNILRKIESFWTGMLGR